jgi:hypothetical protein
MAIGALSTVPLVADQAAEMRGSVEGCAVGVFRCNQ